MRAARAMAEAKHVDARPSCEAEGGYSPKAGRRIAAPRPAVMRRLAAAVFRQARSLSKDEPYFSGECAAGSMIGDAGEFDRPLSGAGSM